MPPYNLHINLKEVTVMLKKSLVIIISALIISSFAACTGNAGQSSADSSSVTSGSAVSADSSSKSDSSSSADSGEVTFSGYEKGIIDTTNIFTKLGISSRAEIMNMLLKIK